MNSDEIAQAVVQALEAEGIPYMLVGSFSSNAYGIPRSTKDVDVVIELGEHPIRNVVDRMGANFKLDPQMSFESVTMTIRHVIQAVGSEFKIELFHLSDDPHDLERFRRRKSVAMESGTAYVASPEDVIITKLNWYSKQNRLRDREDVRDVLAAQGDALDFDYIHSWCEKHRTRDLLDEIRASIPPIL